MYNTKNIKFGLYIKRIMLSNTKVLVALDYFFRSSIYKFVLNVHPEFKELQEFKESQKIRVMKITISDSKISISNTPGSDFYPKLNNFQQVTSPKFLQTRCLSINRSNRTATN